VPIALGEQAPNPCQARLLRLRTGDWRRSRPLRVCQAPSAGAGCTGFLQRLYECWKIRGADEATIRFEWARPHEPHRPSTAGDTSCRLPPADAGRADSAGAAARAGLHRWARCGAVRAEDAAVAFLRAQHCMAVRALIEPQAGVGRHQFDLAAPAVRATDPRMPNGPYGSHGENGTAENGFRSVSCLSFGLSSICTSTQVPTT
jgi:hypothetical protein